MQPILTEGDIVLCINCGQAERGSVCGIAYGNKFLMKRIIAVGGDSVCYDDSGNIFVNETKPGLTNVQIPEGKLFVAGDNRINSIDSRNDEIGLIEQADITGLAFLRIWPVDKIGRIR